MFHQYLYDKIIDDVTASRLPLLKKLATAVSGFTFLYDDKFIASFAHRVT